MALPRNLVDGTIADADDVMANFTELDTRIPEAVQSGLVAVSDASGNVSWKSLADADVAQASALTASRGLQSMALQEGAFEGTALKVSQRAAGANMTVDVAPGTVAVQNDVTGLLERVKKDSVTNVAVPENTSGNPRVDQVVVNTAGEISVLAGTPTAGATLDNAAGNTSRAALPASTMRLGEFVTPNGATSVSSANIRDRRPWARGAAETVMVDGSAATLTYTAAGSPNASGITTPRIELSGAPVYVEFSGLWRHDTANTGSYFYVSANGTRQKGTYVDRLAIANEQYGFNAKFGPLGLAAGSYLFDIKVGTLAGTLTIPYSDNDALVLRIREDVAQDANNGTS